MIFIKALILIHMFVFVCCTLETQTQTIVNAMLNESSSHTINNMCTATQQVYQATVLELIEEVLTAETVKPVVKFISKQNVEFLYTGYLKIFELINLKELGDAALFQLAFQVKKDEQRGNCPRLISQFPIAVKAIISSSPVCIRNRGYGEYLFAGRNEDKYDEERRNVYTRQELDGIGPNNKWILTQLEENKFNIQSALYDEYMYSPYDELKFDPNRRRVFTWIAKSISFPEGTWAIELVGEDVFIRNVHRDEYMYAYDTPLPQSNMRNVATWVPKGRDVCDRGGSFQCRWRLESC